MNKYEEHLFAAIDAIEKWIEQESDLNTKHQLRVIKMRLEALRHD